MRELRFRLLGPLEAERGGVRLDLGPRKQRAVLALLLLEANRVVPTERLIDELWGDSPPETARSALQVYVAGLRKALGDDGASLRTSAPGYVLELEPGALDLEVFAALRAEARDASEPEQVAAALHQALALWRGPPLAELDGEPFGAAAAAQLEEQRLGTLEERIDADLALGRHAELVPELSPLVADHPYRERFRAQQMLALYRAGRQADGLAAYRAAREAFVDGLGIEPGAELRALERAMLDQDPALAAPTSVSPASPVATTGLRRLAPWLVAAAALGVLLVAAAAGLVLRESAGLVAPPNHVAVIDPETNRVVTVVQVGIRPGPIAVGAGAVWAGNLDDRSLTRIDPQARQPLKTIPLEATPTGIAVGARAVWVAHGGTGQVSRVDPQFAQVQLIDVSRTSRGFFTGSVAYGAGAAWAVFGDATLGRIDPSTTRVDTTSAGLRPAGIAFGSGSVWVASSADSAVYRFNAATFLIAPIGRTSVGRRPTGIAFGDGAVWVTSPADDTVTRIQPSTNSIDPIRVGDKPVAVAVGSGAVWVANTGDGSVSRIDLAARQVVETIEVGGAPAGVAIGNGLVWVTVQAR